MASMHTARRSAFSRCGVSVGRIESVLCDRGVVGGGAVMVKSPRVVSRDRSRNCTNSRGSVASRGDREGSMTYLVEFYVCTGVRCQFTELVEGLLLPCGQWSVFGILEDHFRSFLQEHDCRKWTVLFSNESQGDSYQYS